MHSEFLLVTKHSRKLWIWPLPKQSKINSESIAKPHPAGSDLCLDDKKIRLIDSDMVRATIVTESGKICAFFDSFIAGSIVTF